jgi:hypothetical protein
MDASAFQLSIEEQLMDASCVSVARVDFGLHAPRLRG